MTNDPTRWKRVAIGLAAGIVIGAVAALLSVGLAGAGHGTYIPAHLLHPWGMLFFARGETLVPVMIAAGLAQFPVYGALIGWRPALWRWIAGAHVALILLAILSGRFMA